MCNLCSDGKSHDFHESYYEHACSVVAERDVLETDIPGTSVLTRLKKWWYDLFLLSYSDQRARVYYTSSYSMRKDRQLHFRQFHYRIHPLSKFRMFWDIFMLLVLMANELTFHHNTSFIFSNVYRCFYYIGAGLEVIIFSDIFVNLATGYIDETSRKVILDRRLGVLHYCSTKLCFHVASSVPLQWLLFIRLGSNFDCTLCKTTNFICTLEVMSFFDLLRLIEYSRIMSRERQNFKITYGLKFLRITLIALFTMFQFIELADMITLRIMVHQGEIQENSYVAVLLRNKYGNAEPADTFLFFVFDFARICKSILLFSFAFRKSTFYLDRIISLFAYMIANIFYLWTVTECYSLVCRLKFPEDRLILLQDSMLNMVRCRQLSDKVTAKLHRYYSFNFSKLKVVEKHNHFFRSLPPVLIREQYIASYWRFLVRVEYFSEWPTSLKTKIVHMLKQEIYLKHDLVAEVSDLFFDSIFLFQPWVPSEGLCIVAAGELAVFSEGKETGHLIDGDYYGELSLVTDKEVRTSSVVAITPCLILFLSKTPFRRFMRRYPDLFFQMKQQLKGKYGSFTLSIDDTASEIMKRLENKNDLT